MRPSKRKLIIFLTLLVVLVTVAVSVCISAEQVRQKAYNDVLEELEANGHPTGMFGATWYMTQQDVRNLLSNLQQLDADTLVQARTLYGRPIQASYHFKDNTLLIIVVSFKEEFYSIQEFAEAFYEVQDDLSRDYGEMPEPIQHDLTPPVNGMWEDQKFLESTKQMGRTILFHRITIKDNGLGEQIGMFLGEKKS